MIRLIIAFAILIIGSGAVFFLEEDNKFLKMLAPVAVAAVIIATTFFTNIPQNHVGIKYNPFTGVKADTLDAGFKTKSPLDKITTYPTTVQEITLENLTGQTKDGQYVNVTANVKYYVSAPNAYKFFTQFQKMSRAEDTLLPAITQTSVEEITTKYNVFEVMGEQRNNIRVNIEKSLNGRLEKAGLTLYSLTLVDVDAGAEIEAAIKAEAVARQEVQTAEQNKQKAEIDAQVRIVEAEADLEKAKITAEQQIVEAEAEAKSNALIAQSITQGLIDKIEAEARLKHGWVEVTGANTAVVKE